MIKPTFSSVFDIPVFPADASAFAFDSFVLDEVTVPARSQIFWNDPDTLQDFLTTQGVTGISYAYTATSLKLIITKSLVKVSGFNFSYNIPNATITIFVQDSNIQVGYTLDPSVNRGCTDPDASNYNSLATEDDASCVFTPETDEEKLVNCLANKKFHRLHTLGQPISDDQRRLITYLTFVADMTQSYANSGGVLQNAIPATGAILATDIVPQLGIFYQIEANFTHDGITEQLFDVLVNTNGMTQSTFLTAMANLFIAAPFGMSADHDGTTLTVHAPDGTGVQYNGASIAFTVGSPAQASFFDLSPYANPNVNDVRVDVVRLTTPSSTVLGDDRIVSESLTIDQWVAQVGASVIGSGYTGGSSGDDLGVLEPTGTADTGQAQLRVYAFQYPNKIYDVQAFPSPSYKGGVDIGGNFAVLLESGGDLYIVTSDDPGDILSLAGVFNAAISRPVGIAGSATMMYFIDFTDGRFARISLSAPIPPTVTPFYHGASWASGDHGDVIHDPVNNRIWGMAGLKYARISSTNVVTVSSSTAPDDDYLVCNTATGNTYSFVVGGSVLSLLADSGALTTVNLASTASGLLIAGRIGFIGGSFYVPKQGTRRVYVFNSSLVATSFIDLATFDTSATANVEHVMVNDDTIFIQHTDGKITVIKSGTFVCTFFAPAGNILMNSRNVASSKMWIIDDGDGIARVDANAQVTLLEDFAGGQTSADMDFADGINELIMEESDLCLTPAEYNGVLQNALQLCENCPT